MTPAILAVDDERDLLASYERLLGRSGYRVIGSSTRHEGLAVIASERLALVISDLRHAMGEIGRGRPAGGGPPRERVLRSWVIRPGLARGVVARGLRRSRKSTTLTRRRG